MEYYVDGVNGDNGADGSRERPWKTIGVALVRADTGDVVRVGDGVYREVVKLTTPGVALVADEGARPVIEGGWKGEAVEGNPALLSVTANGVTVRGLWLRNSPGKGIGVNANDVIIRDCHVRNCRMDGIVANGLTVKGIRNLVVEDCSFVGLSQKMADGKGDQAAGSSFVMVSVIGGVFRRNVVGDGFKEGFNIDKNTSGCVYEDNVLFDTNHGGCYFNHCQDNIVRWNVFLHTNPEKYRGARGTFPAAVIFGDERAAESRGVSKSRGNQFYGNVVVGWGRFVEVRNNAKDPGGYDTQLLDTVIAGNTFIAGPETTRGVEILANLYGRGHANSVFERNVVWLTGAKEGADIGTMGAGGGVTFSYNGWSVRPPRSMQGAGDVYGELGLTNPGVRVSRLEDEPFVDYNGENYRPVAGSPLTNESIGALLPGVVEPPEDPEPPEPDYGWLVEEIAALRGKVAEAGRALVWVDLKLEELETKFEGLR